MIKIDGYVIGVTGHRYLPQEQIPALSADIELFYNAVTKLHGSEGIIVLSPLAAGADTLCAKLALDAGFSLVAPLPMSAPKYRADFNEQAAAELDCLLSLSDQVFIAPPDEPVPHNPQRGFYYRQTGIYVAKRCNILLAVWDGIERDTPDGAGTWETVKLALGYGKIVRHVQVEVS